jgi:hypothetical protein
MDKATRTPASSKRRQDDRSLGNTLESKVLELREELAKGQHHLDLLDQQREQVRDTLLRITGAIHVLEELLQQPDKNGARTETAHDVSATRVASVPA